MGVRIRALELLSNTEEGPFGITIPFKDGLNVIWAENSSGKSTCIMSILYALGLEGMLAPGNIVPLSGAMQDRLKRESDGKVLSVISSRIQLEIENDKKERVVVQRGVLGSNWQLIRVIRGPALTAPNDNYPFQDFFVKHKGAATSDAGFHAFLARFMDLDLPEVTTADQAIVPLYLECLFPFFFVDQLSGWRDVKARMPSYLRIPEVAKRAFEYILKLDVLQRELNRHALSQEEQFLRGQWEAEVRTIKREFDRSGMVVDGLGNSPSEVWPPNPLPRLLVTDGNEWKTVTEMVEIFTNRINEISTEEIPKAESVSTAVEGELHDAEVKLYDADRKLTALTNDFNTEQAYVISIDQRLNALKIDLDEYLDIQKVRTRGGISTLKVTAGLCATCGQAIKDALLPQSRPANPMSLEVNIEFIRDQIKTFSDMREESRKSLISKEKEIGAFRTRVGDLNSRIRALKQTLRSDAEAPSIAAIQEQVRTQQRIDDFQKALEVLKEGLARMASHAEKWEDLQGRLKKASAKGLSDDDKRKMQMLNTSFVEQLREYQFDSYPVEEISISEETYRPSLHGLEFGLTSASDVIRCIWAYLLAMLELSRRESTNHLGLLIFDEPKQQSTRDISFAALLKRASASIRFGEQVIFATSEKRDRLDDMLKDIDKTLLPFDTKMLRPLPK